MTTDNLIKNTGSIAPYKFIRFILIILIPVMGFCLYSSSSPAPIDSSRTANVIKKKGEWLTIDKGMNHGVEKGMTGMLQFSSGSFYSSRGSFVVTTVYPKTARLHANRIPPGTDIKNVARVLFKYRLTPKPPANIPHISQPPPEENSLKKTYPHQMTPKPTIERYLNVQTIEYSGDGNQFRTVSPYATVVEKRILKNLGRADYTMWTSGHTIKNNKYNRSDFKYGPNKFSRNLTDENVSFNTGGFVLAEEVLNQAIGQVKKGRIKKGYWCKKIQLDLMQGLLSTKVDFHFKAYPIDSNTQKSTFIVKCISEKFYFRTFRDQIHSDDNASGKFTGVFVYSPDSDRLYQTTSIFEARLDDRYLRMEDCGYLVDVNNNEMRRLIDLRKELKLSPAPLEVYKSIEVLPSWAFMAVMEQQAVCLAGFTTAERGTNPVPLTVSFNGRLAVIASGMQINNQCIDIFSNRLTRDYMEQDKNEDEAARSAKKEISRYLADPPIASSETFSTVEDLYFYGLLLHYQDIAIDYTINQLYENAANPGVSSVNLEKYDFSRMEPFEGEPSSLDTIENSELRPPQQTNGNSGGNMRTENGLAKGDTKQGGNQGAHKEDTPQDQNTNKSGNNKNKMAEAKHTDTTNGSNSSDSSIEQKKNVTTSKKTKKGKSNSRPNTVGTVLLGAAAAGGAVYGALELAELLDTGVTGNWNFSLTFKVMGYSSPMNIPITLSGNKDEGTVDWGYGYTGPYRVNGDRITMRLYFQYTCSQGGYRFQFNFNKDISGIIQNDDLMKGNYSMYITYSISGQGASHSDRIHINGTWYAERR